MATETSWRADKATLLLAVLVVAACASTAANPPPAEHTPLPEAVSAPEPIAAPDEASVKPGINDPYFQDDGLDRYTRVLEAESREIVRRKSDIVRAIGLREGMVAADIGAGTGLLTLDMAERVGSDGVVYAVDIVPAFLERIRERVAAAGVDNVVVIEGGERSTGLESASLDLAFMCDTYHHIEYPDPYLFSLFQTLRPGGTLVLVDMKRPEQTTSSRLREHVRADKATVIAEIEAAGFVFDSEIEILRWNYYLRFRRP